MTDANLRVVLMHARDVRDRRDRNNGEVQVI
jgi:hypothetical protein